MARACVIVLDAVGVGDLPDAEAFGTAGSNTLAHVADAVGGLDLPSLQQLGLGNVLPLAGCAPRPDAPSVWGRLAERSLGMDTTTGHWEMVGIVTEQPFPTYPDGFPAELLSEFSRITGRAVIGNVAASGTEIIQRLGEEHQRTGAWIVYTSADSVFQVAAHEATVPVDELYAACLIARQLLVGEHAVGRVIARPFEGQPGAYRRTARRHDFSLTPPRPNHLQRLREAGVTVHGVGKIWDIFAGQDIDTSTSTESNGQGVARTISRLRDLPDRSLVFTNLVETDMVWGHRNDPEGFVESLREFDMELPRLLAALHHGDLLVITSDHGCDPTTASTDHSREHGLLLAHVAGRPAASRRHDGDTFADVGATVQRHLSGAHDRDLPGTPVL
ncbi:MAG: phosphopentomutase [Gaiellales bacterium]|jgi:phosphopentomutase|nr:phosphopentomutase [Gaiellales bacterium]